MSYLQEMVSEFGFAKVALDIHLWQLQLHGSKISYSFLQLLSYALYKYTRGITAIYSLYKCTFTHIFLIYVYYKLLSYLRAMHRYMILKEK